MNRFPATILAVAALCACGRSKADTAAAADSLNPTPMADAPRAVSPETVFVAQVPPPAPRRPARPAPPPPPASRPSGPDPVQGRPGRGTLESGTEIRTAMIDSIHSGYNGPGDPIRASVTNDVSDNGRVVIPAGSIITFRVDAIGPATSRGERGTLGISAESVQINGRTYAIRGSASDYDFEMRARSVNAGDVVTAAGGAGIGAIIGHVIGGKTGTIIGAIGGAAAGTAVAAKNADRDIIVHAGTPVTLVLLEAFDR